MSEHAPTPPKAEVFNSADAGIWFAVFAGAGAIGLLVSLVWALFDKQQFGFSWLVAAMYFFTIAVGGLFWVLVHHATDAEWSVLVRRVLENLAVLVPVTLILFIPALLCAGHIWSWWNIPYGVSSALDKKRWYLSHGFFFLRFLIYFVGLSTVAILLRRNSVSQDANGSPLYTVKMRKLGITGIPIFAFSLTFGAFDWLMGLDYKWGSTMWGVYIFAGAAGSSMSLLVLLVTWLRSKGYLRGVTLEHYHVMGKLMLAFCIFWAYIGFSQYMLIWYANIPEETEYFIRRNIASWHTLSTLLVVGRFFLPLPLLLLPVDEEDAAGHLLGRRLDALNAVPGPLRHHHADAAQDRLRPLLPRSVHRHRHRRHARGALPLDTSQDQPFPAAGPAPAGVAAAEQLTWQTDDQRPLLSAPASSARSCFSARSRRLLGFCSGSPRRSPRMRRSARRSAGTRRRRSMPRRSRKLYSPAQWIDKAKGTLQLPIDTAMDLVVNDYQSKPVQPSQVKVDDPYPYGLQMAAAALPPHRPRRPPSPPRPRDVRPSPLPRR